MGWLYEPWGGARCLVDSSQANWQCKCKISRMRKEKVIVSVNKSKEEDCFQEACPNLFGADFARRSKEFLDQLMAIRTTIPAKSQESTRKPFFRRAPSMRGASSLEGAEPQTHTGAGTGLGQIRSTDSCRLTCVTCNYCSHSCTYFQCSIISQTDATILIVFN